MVTAREANRAAQQELYGEPLADVFGRLMHAFELTQGALASTLGISAPMLSQLNSANRVKIGNPAVVLRLQALQDLAYAVSVGTVEAHEVAQSLTDIRSITGAWTRADAVESSPGDEEIADALRSLLHTVASDQELQEAQSLLRDQHPGLADLVLAYGLSPREAAVEHIRAHKLLR